MSPSIKVGKYILKKKIGEGAFAEVRLAVHEDTKEEFAVKVFDRASLPKADFERDIKREIKIMQCLRHPSIVSIHAVLVTTSKMYLVMELVRGGELYDEIVSKRRVDEQTSRKYFQQIVDAMVYCHSRGVVHRDLKPENLLLDGHGNIKITDFGMSWMKENIDPQSNAKQLLQTQCGTPKYMAPEIIMRPSEGYDGEKLDAWECGMVLYALLAGYLPFSGEDDNSVFRSILRGKLRFPAHFSSGAKDVLGKLLEKDPQHRSSLSEIRNHVWFLVDYNKDAVHDRAAFSTTTVPSPSTTQEPAAVVKADATTKKLAAEASRSDSHVAGRNERLGTSFKENSRSKSRSRLSEKIRGGHLVVAEKKGDGGIDFQLNPKTKATVSVTAIDPANSQQKLDVDMAEDGFSSPDHGLHKNAAPSLHLRISADSSVDDEAPVSLRDRLARTPLAGLFRSLRSGANADQTDSDQNTLSHQESSWFTQKPGSDDSPTSIVNESGVGHTSTTQKVRRIGSHAVNSKASMHSTATNVLRNTASEGDDLDEKVSSLRKVAHLFQRKQNIA